MEDVKRNLHRVKQENNHLEVELRSRHSLHWKVFKLINSPPANASAEQKARHLEQKVVENTHAIDQLRHERSLLVRDHKDLQKKYSEVTNVSTFSMTVVKILIYLFCST